MTETPQAIAARVAALEQRLLVAVVQGDDLARIRARGEIARLKRQLAPAAARLAGTRRSTRTAAAAAPAP
ncbi:hypothetical protein RAMLITH_09495 [Ramlibacter sp. RBP-2]|uniref:Uncharacterized protein n=1 Tax=Ramlibacter lithotrophicus TaxID=2606681 RepID=A0A7X6I665_9BURK|nr:hypothetical protein [Ramlibacter lithotrophicus]NKE66053.1 hypothetical protein [Ramlibacter lithotrophicus]